MVLSGAVAPLTHTGMYFGRSLRDFFGPGSDELPIARPTLALTAQALRDEIVLMGLRARRPVSTPRAFERITD